MRCNLAAARLAVMVMLVIATTAKADVGDPPPPTNILYGFINSNARLTVASPGPIYYVVGDLIVNPGATLTIDPGVTVRFAAFRDTLGGGDYPAMTELRVRGHLVAQGTEADSIRFLSTDDGFGEWGQIKVDAGGDASFRFAVLKGANVGIRQVGTSALLLTDLLIRDCASAVSIEAGSFAARWLVVENCTEGLAAVGGATGTLQTSRFVGRGSSVRGTGVTAGPGVDTTPPDTGLVIPVVVSDYFYGVFLTGGSIRNIVALRNNTGIATSQFCTIDYCTAVANTAGFEAGGILSNSIAAINSIGIRTACNPLTARFVDSWANGANFQTNCAPLFLQNAESLNPFFVAPQADNYRLSPGSVFESFSSTGGQIGAYGPHRGPNVVGTETGASGSAFRVLVSPNPTRGSTRFTTFGAATGDVSLEILDLNGRRVARLGASTAASEGRTLSWDGFDGRGAKAVPGIYYWRLSTSSGSRAGRLVVIK